MRAMHVMAKLGTMRKAQEFTVYPAATKNDNPADTSITIQSDTRIAQFDPATGRGMLSKARSGGAYLLHLTAFMGATPVQVPQDVIDAALAAQPKTGDEIGPGVFVG